MDYVQNNNKLCCFKTNNWNVEKDYIKVFSYTNYDIDSTYAEYTDKSDPSKSKCSESSNDYVDCNEFI